MILHLGLVDMYKDLVIYGFDKNNKKVARLRTDDERSYDEMMELVDDRKNVLQALNDNFDEVSTRYLMVIPGGKV